jgi:hypothetical protein
MNGYRQVEKSLKVTLSSPRVGLDSDRLSIHTKVLETHWSEPGQTASAAPKFK